MPIDEVIFRTHMGFLAECLPSRPGTAAETSVRARVYHRHLSDLDERDFVEACARILYSDEWFPTIARVRAVAGECRSARLASETAQRQQAPAAALVCVTCHGARWVRLGGADPLGVTPGQEGSRCRPCPSCTRDGRYDEQREREAIRLEGGVPNPAGAHEIDLRRVAWPAELAALCDPATGRVDMERLYRRSRELRGLDPEVDARPRPVAGWKTISTAAPVGAGGRQ